MKKLNFKEEIEIEEELKPINDNSITYSYNSVFNLQNINPSFPELYPIGQVLQTLYVIVKMVFI